MNQQVQSQFSKAMVVTYRRQERFDDLARLHFSYEVKLLGERGMAFYEDRKIMFEMMGADGIPDEFEPRLREGTRWAFRHDSSGGFVCFFRDEDDAVWFGLRFS